MTVFICSVTHNIERYTPMNSSPVLPLLGFLWSPDEQTERSQKIVTNIFRPNFRVGGLHKLHPTFVSFNSQVSLSPDEQTERSQFFFGAFFRPNFRVGGLHKLHPTFVSFNSQVSLSPDEQTERSQIFFRTLFRPNFRVGGLHMRHPLCVSQCRVSNRIALCPDEQTERSQSFFQIFFHPNFRVSFLHKLHPPLCLTQFRVSHSDFYKPRRANGALASFFFEHFSVQISEWVSYISFTQFVSHTIRISHYPHLDPTQVCTFVPHLSFTLSLATFEPPILLHISTEPHLSFTILLLGYFWATQ